MISFDYIEYCSLIPPMEFEEKETYEEEDIEDNYEDYVIEQMEDE